MSAPKTGSESGGNVSSHHGIVEAQKQDFEHEENIDNVAAEGTPYYTPAQIPPSGTATSPQPNDTPIPKLFKPLTLRSLTLQNRIFLSPLCQYSSDVGHATSWHLAHIGGIVSRGPGLAMVEATSVTPDGRITPQDAGLWTDSQMEPLKQQVDFAHSQGQKMGIQLAHAGRKASTVAPWLSSGAIATEAVGGWPDKVIGPSAIPWNEAHAPVRAMSRADIEDFKRAFGDAVKRALKAGFDAIEIHSAHGYLLHSFLSPVSNARTDDYGGSFENRTRLVREVASLVRSLIPETMPLLLRISGSDYLEESMPETPSWRTEDTVKLAPMLADLGVDLLDVSGGGNHPAQHPHAGPAYQAPMAQAVKAAVGDKMAVTTVGNVREGKQANDLVVGVDGKPGLDAVFVGRFFQKYPGLVWQFAEDLGCEIQIANQIRWGFGGRKGKPKAKEEGKGKL